MFSWYRFQLLVTIPVAPVITGIIVHFRFHIRFISIYKLLYFNFFSASFCTTFLSIIIIIIIIIIIAAAAKPTRLTAVELYYAASGRNLY